MTEKVLLFWSGGKDSALALHQLKSNPDYEVVGLVSVFNREKNRIPFHGIPDSLILEQAKLLKLPLQRVFIPDGATDEEYKQSVGSVLALFAKRGIRTIAFGDIHLEDIRVFREEMLRELEMKAIFPLWKKDTRELMNLFFSTGHKALVTSVMADKLGYEFLACEFNEEYLARLPEGIDPAGENGEFHTFVTFGPTFKMRVAFSKSIAVEEGPYLVSLLKEP
jgi:uncharacterized protein (TIGR00290 family)